MTTKYIVNSEGLIKLNNEYGEIYVDADSGSVRIGTAAENVAPNAQIILGGPDQILKIVSGPPLREWTFESNGDFNLSGSINLTGSINGALNLATTGSNTFNGNQIISGALHVNGGIITVDTLGGDEGGEILLGKPETNTSLTGSGITIDSFQNRLRIFEAGGDNRGGYFDLTTLGNNVSTNLTTPTLYLLEATSDAITYTLSGSFTEDPCRYSIVSNTVNVSSSWFNTSTYTFTPQKSGYWEITAAYDVYRNSEASMIIKKNNGIVATAGSFGAVAQQITKIVYLNGSTDFINIFNVGGAANSRDQYAERSWFQAKWIGE
jgi:hypothetical protein